MYASNYFNKVSFNFPSPLNSMVTMLLTETTTGSVSLVTKPVLVTKPGLFLSQ